MCSFYNVSRSDYYSWLRRPETTPKDTRLLKMIEECQAKHKRRYGYRRVTSWLKSENALTVNHKKVLKIMRRYSLLSVIRRRRLYKYVPNDNLKYANVLNRDFYTSQPNQKWVTDISIYNNGTRNSIFIGNQRSFRQFHSLLQAFKEANYDLVGQTIKSALDIENPRGQIILHSDGGGQYRSFDHKEILDQNGITPYEEQRKWYDANW